MYTIPFQTINWDNIATTEHKGTTGTAYWQTVLLDGLRIRKVIYSDNYKADHWCQKGHLLFVIEGEMITELADGQLFTMKTGVSYQVSDDLSSRRSFTEGGAKLIIIDGGFLALKD